MSSVPEGHCGAASSCVASSPMRRVLAERRRLHDFPAAALIEPDIARIRAILCVVAVGRER